MICLRGVFLRLSRQPVLCCRVIVNIQELPLFVSMACRSMLVLLSSYCGQSFALQFPIDWKRHNTYMQHLHIRYICPEICKLIGHASWHKGYLDLGYS